jgi:hypothetical protein
MLPQQETFKFLGSYTLTLDAQDEFHVNHVGMSITLCLQPVVVRISRGTMLVELWDTTLQLIYC